MSSQNYQEFDINLIEFSQNSKPIVRWSNNNEISEEKEKFIWYVISTPLYNEIGQNPTDCSLIFSKYNKINYIALYFTIPDITSRGFGRDMAFCISSIFDIKNFNNSNIINIINNYIKKVLAKSHKEFREQFSVHYKKMKKFKELEPKRFEQLNAPENEVLNLAKMLSITNENEGETEEYHDSIFCQKEIEQCEFNEIFDIKAFSEEVNKIIKKYNDILYKKEFIRKRDPNFETGNFSFIEAYHHIIKNKTKIDNSKVSLLNLSKTMILNHILYAMFTGRTIILQTKKKQKEIIDFAKRLAIIYPMWKDEFLGIFDKDIDDYMAIKYAIVVTPNFVGSKNSANFSIIDWDSSFFLGSICPKDCFITKITDSGNISKESTFLLILLKRIKDVGDLFIVLAARYEYNVPTSYNKATSILETIGFSGYDESILYYWIRCILSKEKRPTLLKIKEGITRGVVAFTPIFYELKYNL